MKQTTTKNTLKFLFASLGLHLFLTVFSFFTPPAKTQKTANLIEIQLATTNSTKTSKNEDVDLRQIVQQEADSYNEETPENSKLLSQKNQKVLKETVSANKGKFQNIHQSLPKLSLPKAIPQLLKHYDATDTVFQSLKKNETFADQEVIPFDGTKSSESLANSPMSQTDDHLKGIDQGLETLLNTKEYKFYSYFSRIREQLSQHWQPKVREKMVKIFHNNQGRSPASLSQERVTKLLITLDEKGLLINVQVLSDSGIQDLDDAAIEAFRAAAPFPNPPKDVMEANGTVQIRWDFVLET